MDAKNENVRSRFVQFLEKMGINKADGERACGFTKGVLSQSSDFKAERITAIHRAFPQLNVLWLITGCGDMVEGEKTEPDKMIISEKNGVPYYNVDFVCGFDLVENDQTITPEYLIDFKKYNTADCWCNATGNSMYPEIASGDMIALKELHDWRSYIPYGEIYGIVTTEHRTIKKISRSDKEGYIRLIPSNSSSDYAPQDIPLDIIVRIYRVMGSVKRL